MGGGSGAEELKTIPCIALSLMGKLDGPSRANRFADSRESSDSRESFQVSRTEPFFFANRASGG